MTRQDLLTFLRRHPLGVVSTVSPEGHPEAAVVGIAISDSLEIVFDTLGTTRKAVNLRACPKAALVVGWDREITVQIEGAADEPTGDERERLKNLYFSVYPDGRERATWPGITWFRIRPTWLRCSDFNPPSRIVEIDGATLRDLRAR